MKQIKKEIIIISVAFLFLIISLIFDKQIFLFIQSLRNSKSDAFFSFFLFFEKEFIFYPLLLIIISLILFWKKKKFIIPFIISSVISLILVFILKTTISRTRPLISSNDSFPSGHATCVSTPIPFLKYDTYRKIFKIINILWIIIAFLFALTRVWFGLHYLSDLIGGFIVGYTISLIIIFIKSKKEKNQKKKKKKERKKERKKRKV